MIRCPSPIAGGIVLLLACSAPVRLAPPPVEAARRPAAAQLPRSEGSGEGPPFSITISGGISLGAYEAGLNWVLTEWLKTRQSGGRGPLVGVTGASAGAINALLTAVRWCEADRRASLEENAFSSTWRDVGLDGLLPTRPQDYAPRTSTDPQPDFLFSRKNAFIKVLDRVRKDLGTAKYAPGCE